MKNKTKSGISLIMLVITVVILSILAAVVILSVKNTNVIDEAEKVAFKSDMATYNDIYDIYVVEKILQDITFDETTLNLTYKDAEFENIFGKIPDKYKDGLKVIKGKLVYITTDKEESEIIEDMGMVPNKMKITNRLVHCTTSNTATSVAYEKSYTSTLTVDAGHTLQKVTVVMGGVNITSSAYNSSTKTITIAEVTDNIVITVIAATTEANTYTITNNLTQVINSNTNVTAKEGTSYTATLTAKTGYTLKTVKVTMAGTDVTSSVYSSSTNIISISSVTGDIIITASATTNAYTVTNSLTNVTTSNTSKSTTYGSKYTATLTPSTNYEINTVTVLVNNVDVTKSVYNSSTNTISINSVTGDIIIIAVATRDSHTVTKNLSNATLSNSSTKVVHGDEYTTTISANEGYAIQNVTVLMGSANITNTAYNSTTKTITIAEVTDNVVITVTTKTAQMYSVTYDLYWSLNNNDAEQVSPGSSYTVDLYVGASDETDDGSHIVEVHMGDDTLFWGLYYERSLYSLHTYCYWRHLYNRPRGLKGALLTCSQRLG